MAPAFPIHGRLLRRRWWVVRSWTPSVCGEDSTTAPCRDGPAMDLASSGDPGELRRSWRAQKDPLADATVDPIVPLAIRQLAILAAVAPLRAGMCPRRPRGVKPNCWCCADGEDQQSHDQKLDHRSLRLMRRFRPRKGG